MLLVRRTWFVMGLLVICVMMVLGCQQVTGEKVEVEVTREVDVTREVFVDVTGEEVVREGVEGDVGGNSGDCADNSEDCPVALLVPPGADGVGDPFYAQLGNAGYDAQHYSLDLSVDMANNTIESKMTLLAKATEQLSTFNLDFVGLEISQIKVDGAVVNFSRDEAELTIFLPQTLGEGDLFTVKVSYSGVPGEAMYPDVVPPGAKVGWIYYGEGVAVYGEPSSSAGWFPVNEHPQDKATYSFRITVAKPFVAAANGLLKETIDNGDSRTYVWQAREPIASYLVTLNIADFELQTEEGPNGVPIRNYFASTIPAETRALFSRQAEMMAFFNDLFGPYPFEVYGVVVHDRYEGWVIESQTLSVFGRANAREGMVVHELAHQWFGNSVSLANWQELWLNEGFTDYAELLWIEHDQGQEAMEEALRARYSYMAPGERVIWLPKEVILGFLPGRNNPQFFSREKIWLLLETLFADNLPKEDLSALQNRVPNNGLGSQELATLIGGLSLDGTRLPLSRFNKFLILVEQKQFMNPYTELVPPGKLDPQQLFNPAVYERSGLMLHALRLKVGDNTFFDTLRTYIARFKNGNANTSDFIALAEEVSAQELTPFFDDWLYAEQIPDIPQMDLYRKDFLFSDQQ